jgi:hypothetical protein
VKYQTKTSKSDTRDCIPNYFLLMRWLSVFAVPTVLILATAYGLLYGFSEILEPYFAILLCTAYLARFLFLRSYKRAADFVGTRIDEGEHVLDPIQNWSVGIAIIFFLLLAALLPFLWGW